MTRTSKALFIVFIFLFALFLYGITLYTHPATLPSGDSLESPSLVHWLGTDDLGMDIFAQISSGFFSSMFIGVTTAFITFLFGGALGLLSGFSDGIADTIISFFINLFLSVPQLPIMIVIGAFWGQSQWNVIFIIALFSWANIAKVIRARTISLRSTGYVRMATSYGGNAFYVLLHHLALDIFPLLFVHSLAVIGKSILQEASLAFLGLSDPLAKSWGLMINKCVAFRGIYFTNYWTWWLLPVVFTLIITVLCIRLFSREMEKNL